MKLLSVLLAVASADICRGKFVLNTKSWSSKMITASSNLTSSIGSQCRVSHLAVDPGSQPSLTIMASNKPAATVGGIKKARQGLMKEIASLATAKSTLLLL